MRKLFALAMLVPVAAFAAGGPIVLFASPTQLTLTDCLLAGSVNGTLVEGAYLLTVTDADAWVCPGVSSCAANGIKLPMGTVLIVAVGGGGTGATTAFSCRSTGGIADVQFTKVPAN